MSEHANNVFCVGARVEKTTGDYTYRGEVRGVVVKRSGAIRYVVEDERGLLFIFSGVQLRAEAPGGPAAGA